MKRGWSSLSSISSFAVDSFNGCAFVLEESVDTEEWQEDEELMLEPEGEEVLGDIFVVLCDELPNQYRARRFRNCRLAISLPCERNV